MNTVKVVRATYEGFDTIEGEYDVLYNGERIGSVVRHDETPAGYFGRWSAGRYYTDTRKDAVRHLVGRHESGSQRRPRHPTSGA